MALKRTIDVLVAGATLVVLAPLLAVAAIAVVVESGRPVLFRQERVGRDGELFTFLKLRSMPQDSASVASAEAGTLTVTRVGRVIRRLNIDELPQLLNVLRGEMSLVGPRPPIPAQTGLVELRRRNRALALRPGLTGLAQVNAYDGMGEEEKARWDGEYAERISLVTDLTIIARTFWYLLRPPPVY